MVNGGDIIHPLSPWVEAEFSRVSVRIPKSKPSCAITKINELTYNIGYDSDGEINPFLDTVEGERDGVDKDGKLPSGMCAGSNYGAVVSSTIAKAATEIFSDDGSRDYWEGGATGGF